MNSSLELYEQLPALVERVEMTNADNDEARQSIIDRVRALTDYGEVRYGVETLIDLVSDGDIKILLEDFQLLMQISGHVGSERYSWVDFAPEGCRLAR